MSPCHQVYGYGDRDKGVGYKILNWQVHTTHTTHITHQPLQAPIYYARGLISKF
jgi:hypothetical protein